MITSKIANVATLIYYDGVEESNVRNMPFYPDCNMRQLSEVNMTVTANVKQEFTMEAIIKNYHGEANQYGLGSTMAMILYEMTNTKSPNHASIVSANYVNLKGNPVTLTVPNMYARSVTVGRLKKSLKALGKNVDHLQGKTRYRHLCRFYD